MSKWIPVSERLPEWEKITSDWRETVFVKIRLTNQEVRNGVYYDECGEFGWDTHEGAIPESAVTHWLDPYPPEAE